MPLEWLLDLCERLQALDKPVECLTHAGLPHTFRGEGGPLFMQRAAAFFDQYLRTQ